MFTDIRGLLEHEKEGQVGSQGIIVKSLFVERPPGAMAMMVHVQSFFWFACRVALFYACSLVL